MTALESTPISAVLETQADRLARAQSMELLPLRNRLLVIVAELTGTSVNPSHGFSEAENRALDQDLKSALARKITEAQTPEDIVKIVKDFIAKL